MFLVNGEILSKKDHPDEYGWLQKKLAEIRSEKKKTIVFKAFDGPSYQTTENGGKRKTTRSRLISAESSFPFSPDDNPDNAIFQTWAYFPHQSSLKNESGIYVLRNKGMRLYQSNVYSINRKDDIEQVVFLRYISQNRFIKEVDEAKDARVKADKIMNETEAKSLIYSSKSPIHPDVIGTEDAIRSVASIWGLPSIDQLALSEVQNQLWDRVSLSQHRYNQTKRGYKEFVEEALKLGDGSKRTTIILGIKKGVLVCKDNFWYLTTKGGVEQPLTAVFGNANQQDEEIIRFLLNNERAFEMVELAVESGDSSLIVDKLGKEPTYNEMKAEANTRLGWPFAKLSKMKKPEIEAILKGNTEYKE